MHPSPSPSLVLRSRTLGPIDFRDVEPASPPPLAIRSYRPELVAAVQRAEAILREHGAVSDGKVYTKSKARYRAGRLIRLMVQLQLAERWELVERVWPDARGHRWSVQLAQGANDGSR